MVIMTERKRGRQAGSEEEHQAAVEGCINDMTITQVRLAFNSL